MRKKKDKEKISVNSTASFFRSDHTLHLRSEELLGILYVLRSMPNIEGDEVACLL